VFKSKSIISISIIGCLLMFTACSSINILSCKNDSSVYSKQQQANEYVQKAIKAAWYTNIYSPSKPEVILDSYKKAIAINPNDLNLKFYLASVQILERKNIEALKSYENILSKDPNNFSAGIFYAVYNNAVGNSDIYQREIKRLKNIYPKKTEKYISIISDCNRVTTMKLLTKAYKIESSKPGAIVLGDALKFDGTPTKTMLGRVTKALELYNKNNDINIIVTGGVAESGITEAYFMKHWLVSKGVPESQIYMENRARDTVENAIYSLRIARKIGLKDIVLITSANHIRRSFTLFNEMIKTQKLNVRLTNLTYMNFDSMDEAMQVSSNEMIDIYRDTFRASGIWLFPALRQ